MTQAGQKHGIKTIFDLAKNASKLVMIGPPEFEGRKIYLGLKKAYGNFQLKAYKAADPGLRYQALKKWAS
jgi:osmoprotectant transport system substrate-binding protein